MANKYGNRKVVVNGIKYDSKKEFERHLYLKASEKRGEITELTLQPKFELIPKQTRKEIVQLKTKEKEVERVLEQNISYIGDFSYKKNGEIIVEDVKMEKGFYPQEYVIKRKLMLYIHNIRVKEVYNATDSI